MLRNFLFLSILALFSNALQQFRFDYEFSDRAGGWLKYHIIPATFRNARMRCQAEGAVLASPLNHQLKTAIINHILRRKGSAPLTIFTGIHATFHQGVYTSIEGVPLDRIPITWASGEPDNYNNGESCLVMLINSNGTIADARCEDVLPYICYKKDTPLTMNECGTTDPGYALEPRTGSCYKFHNRVLPWSEAFMTCVSEGGYLAIINNDLEATVIKEMYGTHPDNTIRSTDPGALGVGFHDWGEHMTFLTIHGETLDEAGYQKWADGQPDNSTRPRSGDQGEFCGTVFRNAQLNDIWCNVPIPFLCEKSRDSLL